MMENWKYYNHAMIPTLAPHEEVDTQCIEDKSIWRENKNALFARWTSDFDCAYETSWWYVIKEAPFEVDSLDSKVRKHIRQALKKVDVRKINYADYVEQICKVHNETCASYENFSGGFMDVDKAQKYTSDLEYWGAFISGTDELIAYMNCRRYETYVETVTSKYMPQYLNLRASDAIHYVICEYYLNECGYKYICSGTRNINHVTNVQDYKIKTFGFRKAYCHLHIEYKPLVDVFVKMIYPLRRVLIKHDSMSIIHQINSVLMMEEICREIKSMNKDEISCIEKDVRKRPSDNWGGTT